MKNEFTIEELKAMLAEKEKEEAAKKKAEAEAKAKKLAEEKQARMKEIKDTEKHLNELYKKYYNDYGSITIERDEKDCDDFLIPFFKSIWF